MVDRKNVKHSTKGARMTGFNKVILAGNLTRDPETRYTPSGTAITKFGLAVNRKWKDSQTGEMREEVTFVDVDSFGKQAETIGNYLKKGRPILVEGRLKLDQWTDNQTQQKRSRLGVVLESFTFLDSGGDGGGDQEGRQATQGRGPSARPGPGAGERARQVAARENPGASQSEYGGDMPPEEDDVPF
jgi:single-strand DNA-binding protein